jgi:acyl dehydratase
MAVDRAAIGRESAPVTLHIDAGRLRFFAKAISETDPIYTDLDAAKNAGHPNLPVPPTFLFGISLEVPDPFESFTELGIDLNTVLHGSQRFTYHALAYAGDDLTMRTRIADVYEKKNGLLEFLVQESTITNQDGTLIAVAENTVVIRNRSDKQEQA